MSSDISWGLVRTTGGSYHLFVVQGQPPVKTFDKFPSEEEILVALSMQRVESQPAS